MVVEAGPSSTGLRSFVKALLGNLSTGDLTSDVRAVLALNMTGSVPKDVVERFQQLYNEAFDATQRREIGAGVTQQIIDDMARFVEQGQWRSTFGEGVDVPTVTVPESAPVGTTTPPPQNVTSDSPRGQGTPILKGEGNATTNTDAPDGGTPPTPAPGPTTPSDPAAPVSGGASGDGDQIGQGINELPHGAQLWLVDGTDYYLKYSVPGHDDVPLLWRIENPDRLDALFSGGVPVPQRLLSASELKALAPWQMGGITSELAYIDSQHPWDLFVEGYQKKAELRPWLNDPSFLAVSAVAYLEGRNELSADELAQTDFYNSYTDEQRAWMERSVTASDAELQSDLDDAINIVLDGLRDAGMANPPVEAARYIATQRLTGQWSEQKTREQTRKLADPFAPGELEKSLWTLLRDPEDSKPQDLKAMEGGFGAVMARVKEIFNEVRVPIAANGESEQERLTRIASELTAGGRTWSDLYASIDRLAAKTPGGLPGGLDTTAGKKDHVETLVAQWVGPQVARGYDDGWISEWAGRLRNDPDAEQELVQVLQQARLDAFPEHTNPNARYVDIVAPAKSLFTETWGQAADEMDPLFLDIMGMKDRTEARKKLRKVGFQRGVEKVMQDVEGAALSAFGGQVRRAV